MTSTLKFQIGLMVAMTFLVGFSFGLYIASQIIGNYITQ